MPQGLGLGAFLCLNDLELDGRVVVYQQINGWVGGAQYASVPRAETDPSV